MDVGRGIAGEGAAKGHSARDAVGIGAAANGQALALEAGILLVDLQQGLDEGRNPDRLRLP